MIEQLPQAEYDKLSPESQKSHDKNVADQEAAEQAGGLQYSSESKNKPKTSLQYCLIAGDRLYRK